MPINKCQYWNTYEPSVCVYWSSEASTCLYVDKKTEAAEGTVDLVSSIKTPLYAPFCNHIGTTVACPNYEASEPGVFQAVCILPDPLRHVCNRLTGKKWVAPVFPIDFSPITGYNDGKCNGNGTDSSCVGYSPQHLGFGRLVPSDTGKLDIKTDGTYSDISEFEIRLPLHFVVYNLRAKLSKCMSWKGPYVPFTVTSGNAPVELGGTWACVNTNDTSSYSSFNSETGPPCNGCKAECVYYSGVCWEYCIDSLLLSGDPILSEQLHELRYYCKENMWTKDLIDAYFSDQGLIYAWSGKRALNAEGAVELEGSVNYTVSSITNTIEEYQIPSVKTYLDTFDTFVVEREKLVLTKGTEVESTFPSFPSLISEFSLIQLAPIIKNRFEAEGIFEVTHFGEVNVVLYGKVFSPGTVFAINISDYEIADAVPNEVFEYDSLLDIRMSRGNTSYNEFYSEYEKAIYTLKALIVSENNINILTDEDNTSFVLEAPLLPKMKLLSGINTLAVFHESSEGLLFSKIDIEKRIIGGALIQNDFAMLGDNILTRIPRDYRQGFYSEVNMNTGSMAFEFTPLTTNGFSCTINYYYDDTCFSSGGITFLGAKEYKVSLGDYVITNFGDEDVKEWFLLGDDGYILIILDLLELNRVFKPWECGNITAEFEDGSSCDFEVVISGADNEFMEVNQLIIKPKDVADFKSLCSATIIIKDLVFYKKLSFGEEPDGGNFEVTSGSSDDGSTNYIKYDYSATVSDNIVNVVDFPPGITPSVVISNTAGRAFNLFRTKAIGWVKQPACPAVEIYYSWGANYTSYTNRPVCVCCGQATSVNGQPSYHSMSPPCGDHDISPFSRIGPVWWPFTACDSFTTYNIISNLDNYSYDVIGLFKQISDSGDKVHGDHDMRMLGPAEYHAWHGRGCNFLMGCRCNWRTFCDEKTGDNVFTGSGKIRSGVPDYQLQIWNEEGSTLPKFGNAHRPQLDSYLTIEYLPYPITTDGTTWTTRRGLMPAFMGFNKADFLEKADDGLWSYSASVIENSAPVYNPLGFFSASSFENVSINETVDNVNRFTLGEICHARAIVDAISYPAVAGKYMSYKKEGPMHPWYEFKAYSPPKTAEDLIEENEDDGDSGAGPMVQWAWQEVWQPIVRVTTEDTTKKDFIRSFLTNVPDTPADLTLGGPFVVSETDGALGMFKFLNINYSDYLYNYKTEEFTTVIPEGFHKLTFIAPEKDSSTGEYTDYIKIKLNEGPARGISWSTKDWLREDDLTEGIDSEDDEYNLKLYSLFTGEDASVMEGNIETEWFDGVSLFSTECPTKIEGAASTAENAGRMVESYYLDSDEQVITKKTCFQKGLDVSINPAGFVGGFLPTVFYSVGTNLSENNDIGNAEDHLLVCGLGEAHTITATFDGSVKTIAALEITYSYGAALLDGGVEEAEAEEEGTLEQVEKESIYRYYHMPAFTVYSSSDGMAKDEILYTKGSMTFYLDPNEALAKETIPYSWDNTFEYLYGGSEYIIIVFRNTPTEDELAALTKSELATYDAAINYVSYSVFDIYEEVLIDAVEPIQTWERKYYVSYGDSGDSPPQGVDPEETSTLYTRATEKSTVYTKDTSQGVLNIEGSAANRFTIMSKVRGRVLGKLYEDGTVLKNDLHAMEGRQKVLFDEAVHFSEPYAVMSPVVPPSLIKLLDEEQICFYGPYLTLENTLMTELAEINQFEPMNGQGHKYIPNYSGYDKTCTMCADGPASSMEFVFTCMDEEADGSYTGQGYKSAFNAYYFGTYDYIVRRDLAQLTIDKVFGKKYGGSTDIKIWSGEEESSLVFPSLEPLFLGAPLNSSSAPYNLEYLKLSMNWHNAYFNTAEKYGGS